MEINKKGFTLTEILIVIAVIGLIIAISIPSIITIRKKINERLFNGKKESILVAAELYASDNELTDNSELSLDDLLSKGYIDADVENGKNGCENNNGCMVNPIDNSIITGQKLLIRKYEDSYVAIWVDQSETVVNETLVELVKGNFCVGKSITANQPCLIKGSNPDNYLYYSGIMWRILGVYLIDDVEVVKLISDDTVTWEE